MKPNFAERALEYALWQKGLVMKAKRNYSVAFKRQVVEELLSGSATTGQLSRRYEISSGLIGDWKNRYLEGDYMSFEDVKKRIPYFIEEVYNEKRLHSALGYCPPNEYEELVARSINSDRQTVLTSEVLCV